MRLADLRMRTCGCIAQIYPNEEIMDGENTLQQPVIGRIRKSTPFAWKLPDFPLILPYIETQNTRNTMGKNKQKRTKYSQKEEQQGKKVLITIAAVLIVLVLVMFIAYSSF